MIGGNPMDGGLHFTAIRSVATSGLRIVRAVHFRDRARCVLRYVCALDEVPATQANLASWCEAEELFRRIFAEVVLLDVQLAREDDVASSGSGILGIVDDFEMLDFPLRIVVNNDLQRTQDGHRALRTLVEIFADVVLEHGELDDAAGLRCSNGSAEAAQCFGSVTTTANA